MASVYSRPFYGVPPSSDAKLEQAKALGADHLVNYRVDQEWGKRARALTGGIGVDHVVEVGGAGTLAQSVKAVRGGGTISLIGVLGGAAGDLRLPQVVTQNIRLQGVTIGNRDMFEDMLRAMEGHRLRPVIDPKVYSPIEAAEAIRRLPDGRHVGKVGLSYAEAGPG